PAAGGDVMSQPDPDPRPPVDPTLDPTPAAPPGPFETFATSNFPKGHLLSHDATDDRRLGDAPPGPVPADGPRFRVLRPLGKGGLGEVFVALDPGLNREVALKEIRAEHRGQGESLGRFLLEAEVTGRLEHPGVVPVYALGRHPDGRAYYAMRLIKGETLHDAL